MSWNPLGWLHFRLTGGWRTNVSVAAAYLLLVGLGAAILYRLASPQEDQSVSVGGLTLVTILQGAFALLLAPGAIRRAVQRDFQTGMIDSHRLSPMSHRKIVLGYLTGPPVQAAWLFVAGLLLGTAFGADLATNLSPYVLTGWYALQVCLLCLAGLLASVVLLVALSTAGKTNVLGVMTIVIALGGWFAVPFVPGIALLTGVIGAGTLFPYLFGGGVAGVTADSRSMVSAAAGQVLFALIFLWAACRKVRGPDRAMFGVGSGLLLAAAWAVKLVVGVLALPSYHWLVSEFRDIGLAQLVASSGAFLLVAMFPLVGAAVEQYHADRARAFGAPVAAWRGRVASLVPLLVGGAAMGTLVMMFRCMDPNLIARSPAVPWGFASPERNLAMAAALLLSFWTDYQIMYLAVARGFKLFRFLVLVLAVLIVLPLLLDLALLSVAETAAAQRYEPAPRFADMPCAGFSPLGTLILCLSAGGTPWAGLAGQALVAVGATWLSRRARPVAVARAVTVPRGALPQ